MNLDRLHPVLQKFLDQFNMRDPPPIPVNRDSKKQINFQGSYIVNAETIKLALSEFIHCIGQGGGLLAGKRIDLISPNITLEGNENDPVQLVVLENLSIKANTLKIKNVVLYLFNNATYSIDVRRFISEIENFRIVQINIVNEVLVEKEFASWTNLINGIDSEDDVY